jgi:rhodanese-related sulfurtransferase
MAIDIRSLVLQTPAASPERAAQHFSSRLALETDPSDVHHDLTHQKPGLVVLDVRSAAAYEEMHVPGALHLAHARIDDKSSAILARRGLVVVYCWDTACNAATKAGLRLAGLGFQVKEMIGGLEAWVREGYPTEGPLSPLDFHAYLRRHSRLP